MRIFLVLLLHAAFLDYSWHMARKPREPAVVYNRCFLSDDELFFVSLIFNGEARFKVSLSYFN